MARLINGADGETAATASSVPSPRLACRRPATAMIACVTTSGATLHASTTAHIAAVSGAMQEMCDWW